MISRKAGWILAAAFWTVYGLLTGFEVWISMIAHGHSVPRLLGYFVLVWEAWLAFTFVITVLVRRWPVIPPRGRNIAVHIVAAAVVGVVHSAYWMALLIWLRPYDVRQSPISTPDILDFLLSRLPVDLILYSAVVAIVHAVEYYRRYREREVEAAQLEASLSSARLHALELQIQPHFLFNTLNAVSSLVRTGRNDEAVVMIAGLSDLLRYTLDHAGDQSVTLEDETAMLVRYLEIQRARFPDRLTFTIDIDPNARHAAVPTLILQPLAENAIRHGIAASAGAGTLNVRAFRRNGDLRIEIFNTGSLNHDREGIGLRNTRERLQRLYGDAQSFDLRESSGGVMASLSIPWREIG
ncbi:MAG TPA: histidine kinase [Thermoanaerobaculia bacterium]|nr:histidine kinase [Thermoanaerobaculia bacterium]